MAKKMTSTTFNKLLSSLDDKKKIYVCGDNEMLVSKTFKVSEIQKLIITYLEVLQKVRQTESVTNETILASAGIINVLILKYFTNVESFVKIDTDDIDGLIKVSNALLDLGIVEKCVEAFEKEEVEKLKNMLDRVEKNSGEVMAELAIQMELNKENGEENANGQESE